MNRIVNAFARGLRDLKEPRILAVMLLPPLGALAIWVTLSLVFWTEWTNMLEGLAAGTAAGRFLEQFHAGWLVDSLAALGVIVLVIPAAFITTVVITEIVAMPVIVGVVAGRRFPRLEKRAGGGLAGSILNAAAAILIFAAVWIVTLPLWFTGIAAFVLPLLTSAYLNQRLFRYDALAEHASREEYGRLVTETKGALYGLGLVVAVLYYIPVVNLVAPAVTGLAFTHFCLAELERQRATGRPE